MMSRRHGIQPRLAQLSQEQRDALARWLGVEGVTYKEAKRRLRADFSFEASLSALSKFYHTVCLPQKWHSDLAGGRAANAPGCVLVEIVVRANPDQSLSISVVGGSVAARIEAIGSRDSSAQSILRVVQVDNPAVVAAAATPTH